MSKEFDKRVQNAVDKLKAPNLFADGEQFGANILTNYAMNKMNEKTYQEVDPFADMPAKTALMEPPEQIVADPFADMQPTERMLLQQQKQDIWGVREPIAQKSQQFIEPNMEFLPEENQAPIVVGSPEHAQFINQMLHSGESGGFTPESDVVQVPSIGKFGEMAPLMEKTPEIKKQAESLITRLFKNIGNLVPEVGQTIISSPYSPIGVPNKDIEPYLSEARKIVEDSGKIKGLVRKEQEARRIATRMAARKQLPKIPIPPPEKPSEYAVDIGTNIGKFVLTLEALGAVAPVGTPAPIIWEAQNLLTGGIPGQGLALRSALGQIGRIPTTTMLGKGAKVGLESGLFAGTTYATGGTKTDIIASALVPVVWNTYSFTRQRVELRRYEHALKTNAENAHKARLNEINRQYNQEIKSRRNTVEARRLAEERGISPRKAAQEVRKMATRNRDLRIRGSEVIWSEEVRNVNAAVNEAKRRILHDDAFAPAKEKWDRWRVKAEKMQKSKNPETRRKGQDILDYMSTTQPPSERLNLPTTRAGEAIETIREFGQKPVKQIVEEITKPKKPLAAEDLGLQPGIRKAGGEIKAPKPVEAAPPPVTVKPEKKAGSITEDEKDQLRERGYTVPQILDMEPEKAREILSGKEELEQPPAGEAKQEVEVTQKRPTSKIYAVPAGVAEEGILTFSRDESIPRAYGAPTKAINIPDDLILQMQDASGAFTEEGAEILGKLGGRSKIGELNEAEARGYMAVEESPGYILMRPEVMKQFAQKQLSAEQPPVGEAELPFDIKQYPKQEVPIADLRLSEEVPQFKEEASKETGVVRGQELQGEYRRLGTGNIVVWERLDGTHEVVTGRHRLDLARRTGQETIPAQIVKESEGFTAKDALTLDAELNIMDNQGSIRDYVQYFRNTEITEAEGRAKGLLRTAKAKNGFTIGKNASDDVYYDFLNRKLSEVKAVAIARGAPNNESAQQAARQKAKSLSPEELEEYAKIVARMKPSDKLKAKQGNLFGYDETALMEAEAIAKAVGEETRRLKDRILAVQGALKRPEQAREMGLEFTDEASIREEVKRLENRIDELSRYETNPKLYAEMRAKAGLEAEEATSEEKPEAPKEEKAAPKPKEKPKPAKEEKVSPADLKRAEPTITVVRAKPMTPEEIEKRLDEIDTMPEGPEKETEYLKLAAQNVLSRQLQAEAEIKRLLAKYNLNDVEVEKVEELKPPSEEARAERRGRPTGMTLTTGERQIVYLALGADIETGGHEFMHIIYPRLNASDRKVLDAHYGTGIKAEEAMAKDFGKYNRDRTAPTSRLKLIFAKIRAMLRRLASFLRGKGYHTVEDVFGKIATGKAELREAPRIEIGPAYEWGLFGELPGGIIQGKQGQLGFDLEKARITERKAERAKPALIKAVDDVIERTLKPGSNDVQVTADEVAADLAGQKELFYNPSNVKPEVRAAYDEVVKGKKLFELRYEVKEPSDIFFSKSERVVSERMPNKMEAGAFKNWLAKQGIRADETKWTGLDELIAQEKYEIRPTEAQIHQMILDEVANLKKILAERRQKRIMEAEHEQITEQSKQPGPGRKPTVHGAVRGARPGGRRGGGEGAERYTGQPEAPGGGVQPPAAPGKAIPVVQGKEDLPEISKDSTSDIEKYLKYEIRYEIKEEETREPIDKNQRYGIGLALDSIARGESFLLADGTGFGKTRQILAVAHIHQQRTGKPSLIVTQNKEIIKGNFEPQAKAIGVDLSKIEIGTYTGMRMGKIGNKNYGVVVFDESHNLKNFESGRAQASRKLTTDTKMYVTATPMDRFTGAAYFLGEISGVSREEMAKRMGFTIQTYTDPQTGQTKERVFLNEGHNWQEVIENIIELRDRSIKKGNYLRREIPFQGEVTTRNVALPMDFKTKEDEIYAYWQRRIARARSKRAKINYGGQRTGELSRYTDSQKIRPVFELVMRDLREGKKVIVVAEGIAPTFIKGLGNEAVPGFIGDFAQMLKAAGVDHAAIYGGGNKSKEIEKFQNDDVRIAVMTPASGGAGVDLDDIVGDDPRTMYIVSMLYAADQFEQTVGRVSRRNTKSDSQVYILSSNAISDGKRADIARRKLHTLRAIQKGDDLDRAHGWEIPESGGQILYEIKSEKEILEAHLPAIVRALKKAKKLAPSVRLQQKRTLSKRVGKFAGMMTSKRGTAENTIFTATGALSGKQAEYEAIYESIRDKLSEEVIDAGFELIRTSRKLLPFEKLNLAEAFKKLVDGDYLTLHQAGLIQRFFGPKWRDVTMSRVPLGDRAWLEFIQALNIPRTMLASFDMSGILRQARPLGQAYPKEYADMIAKYHQSFWSQAFADNLDEKITEDPWYEIARRDNVLELPQWGMATTEGMERAERFAGAGLLERVPVLGAPIRASERSFVTALNYFRMAVFSRIMTDANRRGVRMNEADRKRLASRINDLTGRSHIKRSAAAKSLTPLLNAFFSPRFTISRFKPVLTLPIDALRSAKDLRLHEEMRLGLTALISLIATNLLIMYLVKFKFGDEAEIEPDLRSGDGGKIKMGNTRYDLWAGYLQTAQFLMRFATGTRKTGAGKIVPADRKDIIETFGRSKANPIMGLIVDAWTGRTFYGGRFGGPPRGKPGEIMEEMDVPKWVQGVSKETWNRMIPLVIQDAVDALMDAGIPEAVTAGVISFYGAGTATYPAWASTQLQIEQNKLAKKQYGKPWDELGEVQQKRLSREPVLEQLKLQKAQERSEQGPARIDWMLEEQYKIASDIQKQLPDTVQDKMAELGINVSAPGRRLGQFWLNDKRYKFYQDEYLKEMLKRFGSDKSLPRTAKAFQTRMNSAKMVARARLRRKIREGEL